MSQPLFTIVTPALNCAVYLPRNFASVQCQGLSPGEVEQWVIDGGSSDGTLELLQQQRTVQYISERDQGLSDAVNKGIRRATGKWIIWLNADDELAPGALVAFKEAIRRYPEVYLFCGGQEILGYDGHLEAISEGWDYDLKKLLGSRTSVVQASTFVHRSVYAKVGLLDLDCRYAMDYEWTVRAVQHYRCQPLPVVLTRYHRRRGSIMDVHLAGQCREFLRVRRRYRQSYFTSAEWWIRFYLLSEWVRRVRTIRKIVRQIKRVMGREPVHPIS